MAKSFAITTTATEVLRTDAKGHAEAGFTVTNTTSRPIRGLATVKPLADTRREWVNIKGEAEREFAPFATQRFTVTFDLARSGAAGAMPSGTTAAPGPQLRPAVRKYPFRLDVESALNLTEGPIVTVTVPVEAMPTAVTPKPKFPWWIILVIVGVVLLIGIIVLIIVLK